MRTIGYIFLILLIFPIGFGILWLVAEYDYAESKFNSLFVPFANRERYHKYPEEISLWRFFLSFFQPRLRWVIALCIYTIIVFFSNYARDFSITRTQMILFGIPIWLVVQVIYNVGAYAGEKHPPLKEQCRKCGRWVGFARNKDEAISNIHLCEFCDPLKQKLCISCGKRWIGQSKWGECETCHQEKTATIKTEAQS